uniref:Uncharacterized protein n=1 Tax=Arundo donax TaxID=35708 RepID=A0A0A9GBJ9_ARUDO
MRLTTRSVLPLWGRASLRFNWGLRVPPELQPAALADGRKGARAPVSKMPLLVMSKISIEQSPRADADKKGSRTEALPRSVAATDVSDGAGHGGDGEVAFSLVRRQLEALNVDNMMLRRVVEDLRAEIRSGRAAPVAPPTVEARRAAPPPSPQPYHAFPAKPDRRGSGKEPAAENAGKAAAPDDVSEELKKALEARRR